MTTMAYVRLDSSSPQIAAAGWQGGGDAPLVHLVGTIEGARADGQVERGWRDPLEALAWMARTFPAEGRWIGYFSYDLGRLFETLPVRAVDDLGVPLFAFSFFKEGAAREMRNESGTACGAPQAEFTRGEYEAAVGRAIEFIRAGDIFQVNLSQRFVLPYAGSAQSIYRRLLRDAPAAYGALLDYGDHALVCNSPELFLKVDADRKMITRPIKGTRPRMSGMQEQLLHSIKDQAELHMIVDLERNDLGRVCEIGSIRVTQAREIETHPTVYHGVATVEGRLRRDVGLVDLLRATFPGGSITGAPKIRAMQIIEELEPTRRGPYCGAIGYVASDGTMQFNIAIRTIILAGGNAYVSVGGGIVADSDPASEYVETLVKARAMFAALGCPSPRTTVR